MASCATCSTSSALYAWPRKTSAAFTSLGAGAGQPDRRIEGEQGRRSVARKNRPAHVAARRHVTNRAVLFDATAQRLAPKARLVVVKASRVEAQVATQRSHVAQQRAGDG